MASNAIPPLSAPSPITATIFSSVSFSLAAVAIPRAAEMDVELWPVSKLSHRLSCLFGKPLNPFNCRKDSNSSLRPVKILCVYAWCPTSHTILSLGKSSTACKAIVKSTVPKLEARCPPVLLTESIRNSLISSASFG